MADQDQDQKPGQGTIAGKLDAAAEVARQFSRWRKNSRLALDDRMLNALSDLEEQFEEPAAAAAPAIAAEPQASFYPRSRYGSKL